MKLRLQNGFTLLELMIVVVIVAILASVAFPSYQEFVRRAKVQEATTILSNMRIRAEQFYQDNRNYTGGAGAACGAADVVGDNFTACIASTAQTFTATATSRAGVGLGAAGSYVFTLNEQNVRGTTTFKGAAVAKACWLIRGNEC